MPSLPLVNPPDSIASGANPARATPVLANPVRMPTVRANTGTFDGVAAAGSRLGDAVASAGDLAFRIKSATDAAFITRSQTQMEAANADFQNWTKTNPDPSTWQEELDARITAAKEDIAQGSKTLSPFSKQRLGLTLNEWETRTRKGVQNQATDQSLQIAQASYTDFITASTANNDLPAIEAKVNEGVAHGIFHATTGQQIMRRAKVQVTTILANAMIEADPFKAERSLQAKDDAGAHTALPDLTPAARETLVFRAHKAAAETRTNTMRDWSQMVVDAREGTGPMPDRETIDQEAAHQGISPKWVTKLFAAPQATDPHEFATAYNAVTGYDETRDPTHEHIAELVGAIEQFKGVAKEKLNTLLSEKIKADDVAAKARLTASGKLTTQLVKFGESSIKDMFEIGGYGSFKAPRRFDTQSGQWVAGAENPKAKQSAEVIMARNLDQFHDWAKKHPDATHEEAQKFINSLNQSHATNNASRLIINSGAFGLPAAPAK